MSSSHIARDATLSIVDPVTSPVWARLVTGTPSTVFHSPVWMRVLQETYDLCLASCVVERDGQPVAGVSWCQRNGFLGQRRITMAFSDFCEPLAVNDADAKALAASVLEDGRPWDLRARASKLPALGVTPVHTSVARWQGIDLAGNAQDLWDRMHSMAQRGVRKAQRSGVKIVRATDKGQLREWFRLHLHLRKSKYRLLAQPYAFFERIWDSFVEPGQGFLLLATYRDRIIAGTLYLLWQDTCYYKFNASDDDFLELRPNNLLLWHGILEARESGCSLLDLGRSPVRQQGLIAFKRNFGALEEDLFSNTYTTGDLDPEAGAEGRRLLKDLTDLFVQDSVPDSVAEQAGALLYRYFA